MISKYVKLQLLFLTMLLLLTAPAFAADGPATPDGPVKGELAGQFMQAEKTPLAHGRLYIYDKAMGLPSADSYVRVPDLMASLDNDGKFSLPLVPGTYYLSAVKKPDAGQLGPPPTGELIYFKIDPKGGIQAFEVTAGRKTDTGIISTALPYKHNQQSRGKDDTLIEGIVIDEKGEPVAGAIIFAYEYPDVLDKSLYVSERTGSNGKFVLNVNEGGTYFLRVRSNYGGGTPKEGDFINARGAKEVIAVTVQKGEKQAGITVQVKKVPERGPLYNGPQKEPVRLGD